MTDDKQAQPRASLSVLDGVSMVVGVVIGIGIFKLPSLVAANVPDGWNFVMDGGAWGGTKLVFALSVPGEVIFIATWIVGALIMLIGALVYAELAAAYPSTGGEYHFLSRAFGQPI